MGVANMGAEAKGSLKRGKGRDRRAAKGGAKGGLK